MIDLAPSNVRVVKMLCQVSPVFGNELFVHFVDFGKNFHFVSKMMIMEILKKVSVDW